LVELVTRLRAALRDTDFCARHRVRAADFTRASPLNFPNVMLLILQKTTLAVQRHLHDFFWWCGEACAPKPVTAGAWTQARAKLRAQAFDELNQTLVLPAAYAPEQRDALRLWQGHRVVAFDGSLVRLPASASVAKVFGMVQVSNQSGATGTAYPEGRISVVYDVLNALALDAQLLPSSVGEVQMAAGQLAALEPGDLAVMDRGYTGYEFLALLAQAGVQFVARCSRASFASVNEMFRRDEAGVSRIVTLRRPQAAARLSARIGTAVWSELPRTLKVRLVSVRLSTGELEVLVTSLLDEAVYPTEVFGPLYHLRWSIETHYQVLKSRLDLENWSGQTLESVRQDFAACVLVSNLESLFTRPAQAQLDAGAATRKHPVRVNRAVAFHALKARVLDLLAGAQPPEAVLMHLQGLFQAAPVTVRAERHCPRRPPSPARSYHYQRRVRKSVF
jgi:hypothetical protein